VDFLDVKLLNNANNGKKKFRFADYRFTGLPNDKNTIKSIEDALNKRWLDKGIQMSVVCDGSALPMFKLVKKISDDISLVDAVRSALSIPSQSLEEVYEWTPREFGKRRFTSEEIEEAKQAVVQSVSETGLIDHVDGDESSFQVRINVTSED
jgi:hypothetical protein